MEKEKLVKCVPVEMMDRLKKLLDRLWEDNNPAGVHLGAIMDEFESDLKALSGVVKEYEADFSARLRFAEEEHKEKLRTLEGDLADCKARISGQDTARNESSEKITQLEEALKLKSGELAASAARLAGEESLLNSKYVARMQELYDRVSRKEHEMLSHWEEKNKVLEGRYSELESEYSDKVRRFKLLEKAQEDEVNSRKEELIKTLERVRVDLEAREWDLRVREEKFAALEKKRATVTEDL